MKTDMYYIILTDLETGEVIGDYDVTLYTLNKMNEKNNIHYKLRIAYRETKELKSIKIGN